MRLGGVIVILLHRVSIHASVKDATYLKELAAIQAFVSIHASVKDATAVMYGNSLCTKVSIHASVKDAT